LTQTGTLNLGIASILCLTLYRPFQPVGQRAFMQQ
jgi:hypothetical protein